MTREFKGTPGPWSVNGELSYYNGSLAREINFGNDGECVAEVVHVDYDAILIGKAPELLEMLSDLVTMYKRDGYLTNADLEDAEELINKALGND